MSLKKKINFEQNQDDISIWLNTSKAYNQNRRLRYLEYLQNLRSIYLQFNKPLTNFYMSYINFANFVTKNAVAATVIMILAIGGMTTVAAEYLAPQSLKPSNILGLDKSTKPTTEEEQEPVQEGKVSDIESDLIPEPIIEEKFTKSCGTTNGFNFLIPSNWECVNRSANSEDIALIAIPPSKNFEFIVSNLGRGISQYSSPEYTTEKLLDDDNCFFNIYKKDSRIVDAFGQCKSLEGQALVSWFSLDMHQQNEIKIKDQEKNQLIEIIKSIGDYKTKPNTKSNNIKTYTNPNYPDLRISYFEDWSLKLNDRGSDGLTLEFSKDGVVLKYDIYVINEPIGFGPFVPVCTNNKNLFLRVENSNFYRVRDNNGKRFYTTSVSENVTVTKEDIFITDFVSTDKYEDANQKWVSFVLGSFAGCMSLYDENPNKIDEEGVFILDTNYPETELVGPEGNKKATMRITLENADLSKTEILKQADQIVANSKF